MVDVSENTPDPMLNPVEDAVESSVEALVEMESPVPAFTPPSAPALKPMSMTIPTTPTQPESVRDLHLLNDVQVTATVELGRTVMPIKEVLKLRRGSVVELDKLVGQPADLIINGTLIARGEVIVINERFGFRITKFLPSSGS